MLYFTYVGFWQWSKQMNLKFRKIFTEKPEIGILLHFEYSDLML
jgi:hypothetical protein